MLNYKDLYDGFLNIMDNTEGYSENLLLISQKWSKVFEDFYLNMIAPISGSTNPNLYLSLKIFQSEFYLAIKNQTIKQQFEIIIQKLHLGVCVGVTMTGIYTTTPPSVPLKLQHCFNTNFSTKVIANLLASTIYNWVSITFSVQNSSGATIKWM